MDIIFGILIIIFVATIWFLICNERTYRQRGKISDWVFEQPDWKHNHMIYDSVDYDRHLLALFMFHNPDTLYKGWDR